MIAFNYDMEAAPKDCRILALRANGDIGVVRWDDQRYNKKPNPYWADDRYHFSVAMCRERPPIAWASLEPQPQPARSER